MKSFGRLLLHSHNDYLRRRVFVAVVVVVKKCLSYKLQCLDFNCNGICLGSILSSLKYFGSRIIVLFSGWRVSHPFLSLSTHLLHLIPLLYVPFYLISILVFNLFVTPLALTRVALSVITAVKPLNYTVSHCCFVLPQAWHSWTCIISEDLKRNYFQWLELFLLFQGLGFTINFQVSIWNYFK